MHRRRRLLGTIVTMLLAIAAVSAGAVMAGSQAVYDDALHWDNWSWGTTVDTNATAHVREGSNSMAVTYNDAWAGLQFHHDGLDTSPYARLEFDLHADGNDFPEITAALYDSSGSSLRRVEVTPYASADGDWYEVTIPLADLNAEGTTVTRLLLQDRSGGAQPTFYVDSLQFASDEDEGVTFTVTTTERGDDAVPGDGVCADGSSRCTLEAAVQEANALDRNVTIRVPTGNYATKDLAIEATGSVHLIGDGIGATVIDAERETVLIVREEANAQVEGMTLTGGFSANHTGGVDNSGTLLLKNVSVTGNSAGQDKELSGTEPVGGIHNRLSGILDLIGSTVSENHSELRGGIRNQGAMNIVDSRIVDNRSEWGVGGIGNSGSLHIERSEIVRNSAFPVGIGGIYSTTTATIVDSVIADNETGTHAAAGLSGSFVLERTTVSGNMAGPDGEGVHAEPDQRIELRDSHIVDNHPVNCSRFVDEADAASSDSDGTCIPPVTAVFIYDNWTHWDNWSWSTSIDRGDTDPVYGGGHSMRVTFHSAWAGLSFHDDGFDTSDFDDLRFAIHTGDDPFPNVRLKVHGADGSQVGTVDPRDYQSDAGDGWTLVSVPLADLNAADTTITRVTLQEASGSPPPAFNIDSYGFFMEDQGLTFNVTTTAAEDDVNPGDGVCETASGECSLQGAVQEANQLTENVTIRVPEGTYNPDSAMAPEGGVCSEGQCFRLAIWAGGSMQIIGEGRDSTIIEVGGSSGIRVGAGAKVEIMGLTVRGARVWVGPGAAIDNRGELVLDNVRVTDNMNGESASGSGPAGVYNSGQLIIRNSTITDNAAEYGAAIVNAGALSIYDTSITGNVAYYGGQGGGIDSTGTLHVERSDISSNSGLTGGIRSTTTAMIVDSTIANNTGTTVGGLRGSFRLHGTKITGNRGGVDSEGGGINVEAEVTLIDSHVLDNSPNDCNKPVTEADSASSDSDGTCIPDDEILTHFIYDNWTHWDNWSWSTSIDRGDTDPVYGGEHSMLVTYNGAWAGLSFHDDGFDTSEFSTIRLAIHTGGNPFPNVRLKVHGADGSEIGKVDPRDYDSDVGDGWLLVTIPLADLHAEDTTITRVTIQEASGSPPPAFNIDGYGFWGE